MQLTDPRAWHVFAAGVGAADDCHNYDAYTDVGRYMINPVSRPDDVGCHVVYHAIFCNHLVLLRLVFRLSQGKTKGFASGERLNPDNRLVGSPCVSQHCKATLKLHGVILGKLPGGLYQPVNAGALTDLRGAWRACQEHLRAHGGGLLTERLPGAGGVATAEGDG